MDVHAMEAQLDSILTLEELDQWAAQHNLSHDPAVNLRRLELFALGIINQAGNGPAEVSVLEHGSIVILLEK